jgi:hypothetical protein
MKANRKSLGVAATLVGMFALGFVSHEAVQDGGLGLLSQARAANDGTNCTVRTLNGAFGVKFEGSAVDKGQYASVSRMTFDGRGVFTVSEIGRFNGDPVDRTFTGPYVVNSDCTGYLDYSSTLSNPPHQAHGDFVIADEAKGLFFTDNETGWVANGQARKM